jgi:hypothetical protein
VLNLIIFEIMKLIRIIIIVSILGIVEYSYTMANDDKDEKKETKASIEWEKTSYDFGKILKNSPAVVEFEFKNSSMIPLVINSVRPTCGCTVADYPREPVQPGKSAAITVKYNTRSIGHFTKSIIVSTNASEGETRLIIKGEVIDN